MISSPIIKQGQQRVYSNCRVRELTDGQLLGGAGLDSNSGNGGGNEVSCCTSFNRSRPKFGQESSQSNVAQDWSRKESLSEEQCLK